MINYINIIIQSYINMSILKKGAGCMFTDGKIVLAGLQKKHKKMVISGISGKCNENELSHVNAFRETTEELLDIENVSHELIESLIETLGEKQINRTDNFTIYVYDFNDLKILLDTTFLYHKTDIYELFPSSLFDLILNRKSKSTSEIATLCLVPWVRDIKFDELFHDDLNRLIPNE
jgi:transcriptional regulator